MISFLPETKFIIPALSYTNTLNITSDLSGVTEAIVFSGWAKFFSHSNLLLIA